MKKTLVVYVTMAAAMILAGGCASQPEADPIVAPTADDAALVAEYDRLLAQGIDDRTQREQLNHIRSQGVDQLRAWMLGEQPATAEQLGKARWNFGNAIKGYNRGLDWPDAPTLKVMRAKGAVKPDGKLDDATWKAVPSIAIAHAAVNKNKLDTPSGLVQLAWDDTHLYAAFRINDNNIIAPTGLEEVQVSQNDSAELFYLENPRFGIYWELNAGPQGEKLDALMMKYPHKWGGVQRLDESLEGMQIGIAIDGTLNEPGDVDKGYTIEVAIPWKQLRASGRPPRKGDQAWIMVGNSDRLNDKKLRYYAHLPITGWFHNIWGYSPAVFE